MGISDLASQMITTVRAQGTAPAYLTVSPDVYALWQNQNGGVEPYAVSGVGVRIRDDLKPKTMLLLGHQTEQPSENEFTLDSVLNKIEHGIYGPDAESAMLLRLALRHRLDSVNGTHEILDELGLSAERGTEQFAVDALAALGLDTYPRAASLFAFAENMVDDPTDKTKVCALLRQIASFIHPTIN